MVAVISGCSYDITKTHPHFLDPARGYARIYNAKHIDNPECGKPDYEFVNSGKTKPIAEMSGFICLPTDEAQNIIKYYNEWKKKNSNCANQ